MMRLMSRGAVVASVLGLALASPAMVNTAFAQAGMPGGSAMPPPPSANDPPPKNNAATTKKPPREKAARAPRKKTTVSDPFGASSAARPSYTDRIDTRPARGELQLEDDPRVTPTMEGGRPGIGMKF